MRYSIPEKRNKSKLRSFTNKLPVLLFCLLVFGFVSKAAWNAYMEKRQSDKAVQTAKLELQKLEERNAFIKGELSRLSTEGGQEVKLREKFGVGRSGEQVAIIVEAESNNDNLSLDENFLSKIKTFFVSLFEK